MAQKNLSCLKQWGIDMKRPIEQYIEAANEEGAQKVIDELRERALQENPNMTEKQWQFLKCFVLAGAIAKAEGVLK